MAKAVGKNLAASVPAPMDDYEMESNMNTMHKAADILADPAKLKKVHKLAGRKHKALAAMIEPHLKKEKKPIRSLDDLKAVASKPLDDGMDN